MSLRDQKRAHTRGALLRAALRLLEERGYEGTTVEAIAAAAEVSLPTLFRYFPSKADLLFADDGERTDAWLAAFHGASAEVSLADALRAGTRAVLTVGVETRRLGALRARLVRLHPELRMRALLTDANAMERAADAIAERQGWDPARDVRPHVVARAALGAMRAAQAVAVAQGADARFFEMADDAWAALDALPELLAAKGRSDADGPAGSAR